MMSVIITEPQKYLFTIVKFYGLQRLPFLFLYPQEG